MKEIEIKFKLKQLNIPIEILDKYNEKHRYYHNLDHIKYMLKNCDNITDDLFLAIIFHDIIYDPLKKDNEEKSAEFFSKFKDNENIVQAILSTKDHISKNELSEKLIELDLKVLKDDFETFMKFEENIFKEYQMVPYDIYLKERIKVLKKLNVEDYKIQYVLNRKPKIAIYPGSFNPFHKGHMDILKKAENHFDKVIIVIGNNVDKNNKKYTLPKFLKYREVINFNGLLNELVKDLNYIPIIRGLRNSEDLNYEMKQYKFLKDMDSKIEFFNIFSNTEYNHISSSSIRYLEKFNKHEKYLIK